MMPLSKFLVVVIHSLCLVGLAGGLRAQTLGTMYLDSSKVFDGYTLFSPSTSRGVYLIDNEGQVIHTWTTTMPPGQAVMLLEDGSLLRTANPGGQLPLSGGGTGGVIERYAWDGTRTWKFDHYTSTYRSHHDVEFLPNGNVLLIVWETNSREEMIAMGRSNDGMTDSVFWTERIIEVQQTGPESGKIVWEWTVEDHLVQDVDASLPNYGSVSLSPHRVDINSGGTRADWLHINSVRYNEDRNEIMVSVRNLHEFWIINRVTGDIVYRYGNPQVYGRGTSESRQLWTQHDARWIPTGFVDAGKIMVFNNGQNRSANNPRSYSTVDVIEPPIENNSYVLESDKAYGPSEPSWRYPTTPDPAFYSVNISGATRLPNGNTLSCLGTSGRLIECNYDGERVWDYISPVSGNGVLPQGQKPINNQVFKVYKYPKNYPAFIGRTLTPSGKLEDGPLSHVTETKNHPNTSYHWFPISEEILIEIGHGAFPNAQGQPRKLHAYDILGRHLGTFGTLPETPGQHNVKVPLGTFIVVAQ